MDADNTIAMIIARNNHYRQRFYLALSVFILSVIIMITLLCVLISIHRNPPHPMYFATDNVTRLIHVVPVNEPNMTLPEIVAWTKEAVVASYSYDYKNYRKQLQGAQKYYTNYGWEQFLSALTASNNLLSLDKYKLIGIASIVEEPTVLGQAENKGSLYWKLQMPVLVTYSKPPYDGSPGSSFSNALVVTVIIQRLPILQSYKGLGIVQLIADLQH